MAEAAAAKPAREATAAAAAEVTTALGKEDEVVNVFKKFDSNGDGKISASEIEGLVRALGSEATPEEVRLMMEEMDLDRDGFVDLKEFSDFFSRHDEGGGGGGGADAERQLMDAFKMYDLDGNGRISARELHRVMKMLGEKCSVKDCAKMISSVDVDGDGCVDFKEFKNMMTNGLGGGTSNEGKKKKKR